MCPSESEIFDSILENAVTLDEEQTRRGWGGWLGKIILFIPRLLWRSITAPLRWWRVGRAVRRSRE